MRSATLALFAGTLFALLMPVPLVVPAGAALASLLLAMTVFRHHMFLRMTTFAILGLVVTSLVAERTIAARLPQQLEGKELLIRGALASLPEASSGRVRFRLRIDDVTFANGEPVDWGTGRIALLSWYRRGGDALPALDSARAHVFRVKLKRPRGLVNPGTFDYERSLFSERVAATGYVREQLAAQPGNPSSMLLIARQWTSIRLSEALAGVPRPGIIEALSLGVRHGIEEQEWQVLRQTATGHLVAISGLHVGMVAIAAFFVVRRGWARVPVLALRLASPRAAAVAAMIIACLYAALAGFTLPTRRALVMVAVVMLCVIVRRHPPTTAALALALLLVLGMDPLAPLSPGFWLSFGATGVLLYLVCARRTFRPVRWQLVKLQLAVALGLMPVTLAVFGEQPLLSPLANLFAIPWTTWIVVPCALLGTLLSAFDPAFGRPVLMVAGWATDVMLDVLSVLADLSPGLAPAVASANWKIAAALVGVMVLLQPRGVPGRFAGALWLLPLLAASPPLLAPGDLRLTVLDVGQGLAVVATAGPRTLVYDTGPRFGTGFDAGRSVLVPFLRARGIRRVDVLVLSHANNDHTGGANAVLEAMPVGKVLFNGMLPTVPVEPCTNGQGWQWGAHDFAVLHPPRGERRVDNDQSCVLRISSTAGAVLLTGDIEAAAERALLVTGLDLTSTVVVAPHHGSATSSTPAFVAATAADIAIFATGYGNRFGFPRPEVRQRWQRAGARWYDTAEHGAVEVIIAADGTPSGVVAARQAERALWRLP